MIVLRREFGDDSDADDNYDGDDGEEREKLKRRKIIMDEFRRRNHVSVAVYFFLLFN